MPAEPRQQENDIICPGCGENLFPEDMRHKQASAQVWSIHCIMCGWQMKDSGKKKVIQGWMKPIHPNRLKAEGLFTTSQVRGFVDKARVEGAVAMCKEDYTGVSDSSAQDSAKRICSKLPPWEPK